MSFRTRRKPGEEPALILRCHPEEAESHAKAGDSRRRTHATTPPLPHPDRDVHSDSGWEGRGCDRTAKQIS
jgi:hypothetical protein